MTIYWEANCAPTRLDRLNLLETTLPQCAQPSKMKDPPPSTLAATHGALNPIPVSPTSFIPHLHLASLILISPPSLPIQLCQTLQIRLSITNATTSSELSTPECPSLIPFKLQFNLSHVCVHLLQEDYLDPCQQTVCTVGRYLDKRSHALFPLYPSYYQNCSLHSQKPSHVLHAHTSNSLVYTNWLEIALMLSSNTQCQLTNS